MTPEEKRKAYYSIPSAVRKESGEMKVFMEFVAAGHLNIDPGTPKNEQPPLPDISCSVGGKQYLFELGEITDEELAAEIGRSLRTGAVAGGAFSEEEPLVRMILKKAGSTYRTDGAPMGLVLHYDKQYPFAPAEYLDRHLAEIALALIPNGPFSRIWIYDGWTKAILWRGTP
jgi:hypothetical protein